jgi:hypothetical protein
MKKYLLILPILLHSLTTLSQKNLYTPLEFKEAYEKGSRSMDGMPGKSYWQNFAIYEIQAEVFPALSILKGKEEIVYFNNSPDTLHSITLQLHQDMYKKGNPRDRYINIEDVTKGMVIYELKINDQVIDLQQNDKIKWENALLIIELNEPLTPISNISLSLSWDFHIPEKTLIRFGKYDSTSYFIAYWFPRVAVYDDVFGWDEFGYDGVHEVNNDYAAFDVSLKLPGNYFVWSTGELVKPEEVLPGVVVERLEQTHNDENITHILDSVDYNKLHDQKERKTWCFKDTLVTDFAFGISDHHVWDAIPVSVKDKEQILINVVYPIESREYLKEMPILLKKSIQYFSNEVPGVEYPFKSYTVFIGLRDMGGGMEYPAFANNQYYVHDSINQALFVHELAHNYLPFYVNINQTQFGWMDEGIASYLECEIFRQMLQEEIFDVWEGEQPLEKYAGKFFDVPVFNPSILFHISVNNFQTNYYRPAFALIMLEDLLGKELFNKCLKEFIIRWNGKRPIPHDLFYTFNDVTGENLNWFWKPWFFEFAYPDLAIGEITGDEVTIINIGNLPIPVYLEIIYQDESKEEVYKTASVWKDGDDRIKLKLGNNKQIKMLKLSDKYVISDVDMSNNIFTYDN